MKKEWMKILLIVASAVGLGCGLMLFIGGIMAAEDTSKEEIPFNKTLKYGKYWCGMMRVNNISYNEFQSSDRGWFKRSYVAVRDGFKYRRNESHPKMSDLESLKGYEIVLGMSIFSGIGWIFASIVCFIGAFKMNKSFIFIGAVGYLVVYLIFTVLFGLIWSSVKTIEKDCQPLFDQHNPDFKDNLMRSSQELLNYSVSCFVLIALCIILNLYFCLWYKIAPPLNLSGLGIAKVTMDTKMEMNPDISVQDKYIQDSSPDSAPQVEKPLTVLYSVSIPDINHTSLPTTQKVALPSIKEEEKEENSKQERFRKLKQYLGSSEFREKQRRKFSQIDIYHKGTVNVSDIISYIALFYAKKDFPLPSQKTIQALLKQDCTEFDDNEFINQILKIIDYSLQTELVRYAADKAAALQVSRIDPKLTQEYLHHLSYKLAHRDEFFDETILPMIPTTAVDFYKFEEIYRVYSSISDQMKLPCLPEAQVWEVAQETACDADPLHLSELKYIVIGALHVSICLVQSHLHNQLFKKNILYIN